MKLSARNQIRGTVTSIEEGAVSSMVAIDAKGIKITGTISVEAVKDLDLTVGKEAYAIVKATEVMIGIGTMKLSARNQLAGKVTSIKDGVVNSIVSLTLTNGDIVTASISKASVKDLGLVVGIEAIAVIKATSVMFGIE